MTFQNGEKYKIVDISRWWDTEGYTIDGNHEGNIREFQDGDIVIVKHDVEHNVEKFYFVGKDGRESQSIQSLVEDSKWCDDCMEYVGR